MSGRFKLEGADMMLLMVTTIAAGVTIPGIPLEALSEVMSKFFDLHKSHFGNDAAAAAHQAYLQIQWALMAYRKDDFITIQKEPQFSRQGRANFISLFNAFNEGGKEKLRAALEEVMKPGGRSSYNEDPIRYSGGEGTSMGDAVILLTSDKELGVKAEYWYLNYTYGRIKKRSQSLRDGGNGKHYDCISFDTPEGESKSVFFDIGNFY